MERYLLFDSGCSLCSSIAHDIETVSRQRLKVASLNDVRMRALLDRTRPGWSFEPTIVEMSDAGVRLFTGWALRLKMLAVLGPQCTWQVVQIIRRATPNEYQAVRRQLLTKGSLAVLGGITFGLGWGQLESQQVHAASSSPDAGLPNNAVKLSLSELESLKNHAAVQTVDKHFGSLKWNDGYRYEKSPQEKGYVLLSVPTQGEYGAKTTFVTIDDTDLGKIYSIVGTLDHAGPHSVTTTWYTANNQLLGTVTKDTHSGKVTTAAPDVVNPEFNTGCFIGCIGSSVSVFCVSQCIACLGNPFSCAICTVCAGPAAISCARMCNF